MKLRNKKTGEIKSIEEIIRDAFLSNELDSLKNIDANWEDVEEPLIKDEKIRKAVRAWAESLGVDKVFVEKPSFEHNRFILSVSGYYEIGFDIDIPENIKPCKSYTIDELCGEEEE